MLKTKAVNHKQLFFLLLILSFTFVFYKFTLSYFFISDDFYYLSFANVSETLTPKSDFYHYSPFFWFTIYTLKAAFGINPLPFHLTGLMLHSINVLAIFIFGKCVYGRIKLALLAAYIYSFFFSHYEVVFWITGIDTSLMVLFYLFALLSFLKLIQFRHSIYLYLYLLFSLAAFLTHEYAISLPIIAILLTFNSGQKVKMKYFILAASPLLFFIVIFILRKIIIASPLVVLIPAFPRFVSSVLKSFAYMLIPIPQFIDNLPKIPLAIFSLSLIILMIVKSISSQKIKLFFVWLAVVIIIFSLTSLPQARYFYLASIPGILLIVHLLGRIHLRFQFMFFVIISFANIFFIHQQRIYWDKTSVISKNVILDTIRLLPSSFNGKKIYFVNFPDSLNNPPWNAYLFRNGLPQALSIYSGRKINDYEFLDDNASLETLKNEHNLIIRYSTVDQTVNLY